MSVEAPCPGTRRPRGFTLVELVAILLLVGILAAAVIPRFSAPPATVGTQTDQMATDIRYVQSLSMTRGERYCLYLGSLTNGTSYQIRNNNCTTAVTHPASGTTTMNLSQNVTFTATGLSAAYIEFDTKGRPTTITPSTGSASVVLSHESEARTISISGETGRVKVQPGA